MRHCTLLYRGFTLIEMVMTIVIVGIMATVLAPIFSQTIQAYTMTERRMELTARARLALERLAREVRQVVPNTLQELSGGEGVEFVTSKTGGRYMSRSDPFQNSVYNPSKRFQKNVSLNSLYVLGTEYSDFNANDVLVIYNDSISALSSRSIGLSGVTSENADGVGAAEVQLLTFDSSKSWNVEPDTKHYQIADYCYDIGVTGEAIYWHRQSGIDCINGLVDWSTADPILVKSESLTADFDYIPTSLSSNALLKVTLTLTEKGETITVSQEIHVRNSP